MQAKWLDSTSAIAVLKCWRSCRATPRWTCMQDRAQYRSAKACLQRLVETCTTNRLQQLVGSLGYRLIAAVKSYQARGHSCRMLYRVPLFSRLAKWRGFTCKARPKRAIAYGYLLWAVSSTAQSNSELTSFMDNIKFMRLRTQGDEQSPCPMLPRIHSTVTLNPLSKVKTSSAFSYDVSLPTERRTRLQDIADKQAKLIELLNSEVGQLRQFKETTVKLNEYYRKKAGEVMEVINGEAAQLERELDFMVVLERAVRSYVEQAKLRVAKLEKDLESQRNKQPRIVEKIVEKRVEVKVPGLPVFVEKPVFKQIIKQVEKPVVKIEYRDRQVEKIVHVDKPVFIDRIIEKVVQRQVPGPPVEKIVEKIVYIDKIVEKEVEKIVQGPPKIVYRDRLIEKPVFVNRPVEKVVYMQKPQT